MKNELSHLLLGMLAAEPGTAIGWLLLFLIVFIERYGWMLGLLSLICAFFLRRASHAMTALLFGLLFSSGLIVIALSFGLKTAFLIKDSERKTTSPPIEIRRPETSD